jgi:hypothetical protein
MARVTDKTDEPSRRSTPAIQSTRYKLRQLNSRRHCRRAWSAWVIDAVEEALRVLSRSLRSTAGAFSERIALATVGQTVRFGKSQHGVSQSGREGKIPPVDCGMPPFDFAGGGIFFCENSLLIPVIPCIRRSESLRCRFSPVKKSGNRKLCECLSPFVTPAPPYGRPHRATAFYYFPLFYSPSIRGEGKLLQRHPTAIGGA